MVRTGEGALAIIKFKDNSLVRLRERSELTVTGTQTGNTMSKSVEVQTGVVGFNVAETTRRRRVPVHITDIGRFYPRHCRRHEQHNGLQIR